MESSKVSGKIEQQPFAPSMKKPKPEKKVRESE
jgi:hypothetical protein